MVRFSFTFLGKRPHLVVYLAIHAILFFLGVALTLLNGWQWQAIGVSLIAAGAVGWLLFVYVLMTEQLSDQIRVLSVVGLLNAFTGRSVGIKSEYDVRLANAQEQIDIMAFGLRALRQDYSRDFSNWRGRANVRILLLDPDYPHAHYAYSDHRDKEEENVAGTIREDVQQFITATESVRGYGGGHKFEVRLYRCLPSINIFRVDDEMFWGPYLVGDQSRNLPTFLIGRNGTLFGRLTKHFDTIWESDDLSRPVN